MKFNESLRAAREHAKLTQQELINRLPVKPDGSPMMSQPNLAKMESNPNTIGSNYSYYIAKVCGISPEWLINETGNMVQNYSLVYENTPEQKALMAMQNMDATTKYQLVKIANSLTEPEKNGTEN